MKQRAPSGHGLQAGLACAQPVAILRVEVKDKGACTGRAHTGSRLGCLGRDLVAGSKGDGLCTPLCNVGLGHWPLLKGS